MITVNGEKVFVPARRQELIDGLKRMGVTQVGGRALRTLSKDDLLKAYCQVRAREVRRRQQAVRRRRAHEFQSQVFAAWSATD